MEMGPGAVQDALIATEGRKRKWDRAQARMHRWPWKEGNGNGTRCRAGCTDSHGRKEMEMGPGSGQDALIATEGRKWKWDQAQGRIHRWPRKD